MQTLLKTGEVAQLLGVSRQHVVDMCDRGEMRCVRVGTHRRVPRAEVEKLTGDRLTREEAKSLWLHRALLAPLLAEPDAVVAKARSTLHRWRAMQRSDGMAVRYFTEWERVLDASLDAVILVMTSPSKQAREMRQNSPFAGVLAAETRAGLLRSFNDHWKQEHEADEAE